MSSSVDGTILITPKYLHCISLSGFSMTTFLESQVDGHDDNDGAGHVTCCTYRAGHDKCAMLCLNTLRSLVLLADSHCSSWFPFSNDLRVCLEKNNTHVTFQLDHKKSRSVYIRIAERWLVASGTCGKKSCQAMPAINGYLWVQTG
jgi:hypothetical protein